MGKSQAEARARLATSRLRAQVLAGFCLIWVAGQAASDPVSQGVTGRCEIHFIGSSTLHDFSGEVNAHPFRLEPHIDADRGRAWWSGAIEVAIADMDTGIERRNRKMRAMFEADRFPIIVADFPKLESTALADARAGAAPNVEFNLTIREAKRPVAAKVSRWTEEGRSASFDAEFELSLESFGLEVPPVLGLLRVGDVVRVRAHVLLEGLPAAERETAAVGRLPEFPASGS